MIRVGLAGYGTMGQVHAEAYKGMDNVKLTVVADVEKDKRDLAQRDLGVNTAPDLETMLRENPVDLVDICLPTYLHEAAITKAMQKEKHIFCEKPLARNLAEGEKLLELTKDYKPKIGIGHVVRFTPAYIQIRDSILQGEIGPAAVVRTARGGGQLPQGWNDWYANFEQSGGVILDLAIHDLDFLRWIFGDVKRVYAKTTYGRTKERLEWALIVLRFKSGVIAHVEGSWTNYPGEFYHTIEVAGKNGLLDFDSRKTNAIRKTTTQQYAAGPKVSIPQDSFQTNPYFRQLQDIIDSIRDNRQPLVEPVDAFATLKVTMAAIESAQTGKVITL